MLSSRRCERLLKLALAARKDRASRRSLTGMMTSGAKVEGPGPFESALERDYFCPPRVRPAGLGLASPARRSTGPAAGRSGNQKYYPDVLVERIETVNGELTQRAELCEIKYRGGNLSGNGSPSSPSSKPAAATPASGAGGSGFPPRLRFDPAAGQRQVFHSRRDTDWILEHQVMESVRALGETTIHQYMASLPGSQWDKAAVLAGCVLPDLQG